MDFSANYFFEALEKEQLQWLPSISVIEEINPILQSIFTTHQPTPSVALNYILCTDDYLLEINRSYLNHDYYTDIITFPTINTNEEIVGDIFISVDRVKDFANTHNISPLHELNRVIIHGALHLAGFNDKTETEQAEMTKMEDRYLEQFIG